MLNGLNVGGRISLSVGIPLLVGGRLDVIYFHKKTRAILQLSMFPRAHTYTFQGKLNVGSYWAGTPS